MGSIFAAAGGVLGVVTRVGVAGASILMFLMALLVGAEVLVRSLFRSSIVGVDEIAAYMLVGVVFLTLPYAHRSDANIRADMLWVRLPASFRRLLGWLWSVLAFVFAAILTVKLMALALESQRLGSTSISSVRVPLFWPQLLMPVGMGLLSLELLRDVLAKLVEALKAMRSPGKGELARAGVD